MTHPVCPTCGARLEEGQPQCPYDVPIEAAPGIGDADSLVSGTQSHADHELHIARWRIHHPDERGATPQVMAWAKERLARAGHRPPGA